MLYWYKGRRATGRYINNAIGKTYKRVGVQGEMWISCDVNKGRE